MKRGVERIVGVLRAWGGYCIIALLLAQTLVVALRYVFSFGVPWALDLLVYLFFLSVVLPGLAVLFGNVSVRVDVFYAVWSPRIRRFVDRVALLVLFAPAMGYAAWASWGTTRRSWAVLESSPTYGGLPGYFLLKTCLTLLFAGLALGAVALALRADPYASADEG